MPCADPCRHPHTGPPPLPSAGLCLLPNLAFASLQPGWGLPGSHTRTCCFLISASLLPPLCAPQKLPPSPSPKPGSASPPKRLSLSPAMSPPCPNCLEPAPPRNPILPQRLDRGMSAPPGCWWARQSFLSAVVSFCAHGAFPSERFLSHLATGPGQRRHVRVLHEHPFVWPEEDPFRKSQAAGSEIKVRSPDLGP